jgi:hypothetical protein
MACSQSSPCQSSDCVPCSQSNPCYQNCGCLNPTTFDCVENFKKNYPNLGLNIGDDLYDLMDKLEVMKAQVNALYAAVFPPTTTSTTTVAP